MALNTRGNLELDATPFRYHNTHHHSQQHQQQPELPPDPPRQSLDSRSMDKTKTTSTETDPYADGSKQKCSLDTARGSPQSLAGKRNFDQTLESSEALENVTHSTQRREEDDNEQQVGLKLLFAASLLQSKEPTTTSGTETDPHHATSRGISLSSLATPTVTSQSSALSSPPLPSKVEATTKSPETLSWHSSNPKVSAAATTATQVPASAIQLVSSSTKTDAAGTLVREPSHLDVLCGRGGLINKHSGNIVYRRVVDHNKTLYKQVPKRHRILVSQSIVQTIQNHGGRFLQSCKDGGWVSIPFRRSVQKTSQALREPIQTNGETENESTGDSEGGKESAASNTSSNKAQKP